MKKFIIFIILLTFLVFSSKENDVKANSDVGKTLVVVSSSDKEYNFDYPGFEIITSTVNTKITGEYFIVYRNYSTKEQIIKKIIVVDRKDIDNKYFTISENEIIYNDMSNVVKYYVIDKNSIILVKEILQESVDNEQPKSNFYISLIRNNTLVFNEELLNDCYATIESIKINSDGIFILGTKYFIYDGIEAFVIYYDFLGNRKGLRYCGGTLNETAKNMEIIGDYVYLIGDTVSVKGDVVKNSTGTDTFIIKLDIKNMLRIVDTCVIGETGNDTCYGSIVLNNNLYIIKHCIDENLKLPFIKLQKFNHELSILDEKVIDTGFYHKVVNMKIEDNKIFLIRFKDDELSENRSIFIDTFDESLNLNNIYKDTLLYDYIIKDACLIGNDFSILFTYQNNTKINVYNLHENKLVDELNISEKLDKLKLIDNRSFYSFNNILSVYSLNSINAKLFAIEEIYSIDDDILKTDIYINGESAYLDLDKSNLCYDINLYGKYNGTYYFINEKIDIIYQQDINVLPNVSLLPNNVYDLHTKITFNGRGVLNDKEISSGYIINEPGEYTFKIYGKDNKSFEINFKISDISINGTTKNEINIDNFVKEDVINNIIAENSNSSEVSKVYTENNINDKKTKIVYWPIAIPTSLAIICTIFILKGVHG